MHHDPAGRPVAGAKRSRSAHRRARDEVPERRERLRLKTGRSVHPVAFLREDPTTRHDLMAALAAAVQAPLLLLGQPPDAPAAGAVPFLAGSTAGDSGPF